ncbi:MAG TPA: AAA family ATPase [Gaiellaceae bacterium]|nr:AAA family ATPase [Gaiellaceae bacterium]
MAAGTARRERKVVTVVFCDLVGFTARAESMDPEDVEELLRPYHERVRAELERHGGTVEKFIGDAVMALFGAPTAHEDDPERAVRAALAIRDFAVEDGLELRVGITTGEALVSLDARPDAGEGMASGDVVNTAARLQSAAPVNGVIVDETTYRATRHAIDYDDAAAVDAKGKSAPIAVRQATQVRARRGVDVAHERRSELVGRAQELGVLRDAFERSRSSRTSQLVTLVGVPGIGKSRLVHELFRIVHEDPELITWRQGRCLAYGEGVTLWALGEIVKAQAGIHEQDPPDVAAEKIGGSVGAVLPDSPDAAWVESHLLALVGLAEESELGGDRRGEAFSAWRRYFEALAENRPLMLVVEDLHWADESLLDFLDELVDWVSDVPLLVVGTARPELLERRPGWGGGKLNATTLALRPLSDEETGILLARLLDRPVLPADEHHALLERAGGNPLYAEQFADLYLERGGTDELALPETIQGIIAARLDGLPEHEKELLRDAAVVGKVFWLGSLPPEPADSESTLHALERKGFVRRQRRSSVEGETELAFAHALVRDVAYTQIARRDRMEKHRLVAGWIESLGRPEDHAEMLAYHWRSALDVARAAGLDWGDLAERTRAAFRDAGDRALTLNSFSVAARYYSDALELSPAEDDTRPELLFKRARALFDAGDESAETALGEARDVLIEHGDHDLAAECEALLARTFWFRGQPDEVLAHLNAAENLIVGADPSPSVARVLGWSSRQRMLAGAYERGLRLAQQALEMAERLHLDDLRVHALTTIGSAKEFLSDTTGRDDLERAIEVGRSTSSALVAGALNNLAVVLDGVDLLRVRELQFESLRVAERFGDASLMRFVRANMVPIEWMLGNWDEALAAADELIAACENGSPHILEGPTRLFRGYIVFARGHRDPALTDFIRSLEVARERSADADILVPALVRNAWVNMQVGRGREARALFLEAVPVLRKHPYARPWMIAEVAVDLGETSAIREIFTGLTPSPGSRAMIAVLDGRFDEAAELYGVAHNRLFEAEARLRRAEQLFTAGQAADGGEQLDKALAFYRSVGATHFVERGQRLIEEAKTG